MKRHWSWFLLLLLCTLQSSRVYAAPAAGPLNRTSLPSDVVRRADLDSFIAQVQNGQPDQIVGLYLPGLAALPVLPQPAGEAHFVTDQRHAATLFSDSLAVGSIGLLAHNHLAGIYFSRMTSRHTAVLIYGDGQTAYYQVDRLEAYHALQPNDPYSDFTSLQDGSRWDSQALFAHVYASGPNLILQTCLDQEGHSSWGRLFVIAAPMPPSLWKLLDGVPH